VTAADLQKGKREGGIDWYTPARKKRKKEGGGRVRVRGRKKKEINLCQRRERGGDPSSQMGCNKLEPSHSPTKRKKDSIFSGRKEVFDRQGKKKKGTNHSQVKGKKAFLTEKRDGPPKRGMGHLPERKGPPIPQKGVRVSNGRKKERWRDAGTERKGKGEKTDPFPFQRGKKKRGIENPIRTGLTLEEGKDKVTLRGRCERKEGGYWKLLTSSRKEREEGSRCGSSKKKDSPASRVPEGFREKPRNENLATGKRDPYWFMGRGLPPVRKSRKIADYSLRGEKKGSLHPREDGYLLILQ